MNMMPVSDAAKAAIRDAMARELAPATIVGIKVRPEINHYDEEILWVEVLLENDKPQIPGRKLMSASVEAQKALSANNDARFAVIDYLSASDIDEPVG
ncbi:MAG: hypothetical protein ACT4OK_16090 [Gemmobacter sp.]